MHFSFLGPSPSKPSTTSAGSSNTSGTTTTRSTSSSGTGSWTTSSYASSSGSSTTSGSSSSGGSGSSSSSTGTGNSGSSSSGGDQWSIKFQPAPTPSIICCHSLHRINMFHFLPPFLCIKTVYGICCILYYLCIYMFSPFFCCTSLHFCIDLLWRW